MAVTLLHKRSSTNNTVPTTGNLSLGEIAINNRNNKLFIRSFDDSIIQFCPLNDGDKGDISVSNAGQTFTIDNAAVTIAKISATGTADNTTFLRGDGAWAVPSGGGGGGGGTKTYAVFTPLDGQPPQTGFPTISALANSLIMAYDFDASTDETVHFVGVMPEAASLASGLKIRIHWAANATTGICRWGVQLERMNTAVNVAGSFDTAATAGTTTSGTAYVPNVTEITITAIDGITAGDPYRLKVYRDADGTSGTDSLTVDAQLFAVEVRSAA